MIVSKASIYKDPGLNINICSLGLDHPSLVTGLGYTLEKGLNLNAIKE